MQQSVSRHAFGGALGAMLATQIAAACVLAAVPVMAPAIAATLGISSSLVGVYSGVVFAAATVVSASSGAVIARLGPVRTNQFALVGSGAALLLATGATLPALALTALGVGAGYALNTPSSSQVLSRVTPPRRRGIAFSVKQSGAPVGGVVAGLALPPIVALAGWQGAIAVAFAFAVVIAVAVEPLRRRIDPGEAKATDTGRVSARASMRLVLEEAPLRRLTVGGVALMVAHACFQTLLVAYLVDRVALSLALAGVLYASMQAAGAVSRVVIGWGVDRLGDARAILSAVAVVAVVGSMLVAAFGPGWSVPAMWVVCVVAGIGSSGWYGAFLSEVARVASAERAGFATGGVLFFVYGAHVVAPIAGSLLVAITGSYASVFAMIAVMAVLAAASFARVAAGSRESMGGE